jgi:flagellar basal-body rod modification protein FlgD
MNVSSVQTTSVSEVSQADAAKASIDYDAFLKLMLEQLKKQDPTDPVDQTQTLAQLASFSNVEQSIKLNEKLDRLLGQTGLGQSVQLIGRNIESRDGSVSGIVTSIELSGSDVMAVLDTGAKIDVTAGITVR